MDQLKNSLNSSLIYVQNIDIVKILLATLIFGLLYRTESIFISIISISCYGLYLFLNREKHLKSIVIFESVFMLFVYLFVELLPLWGCFGLPSNYEENIYYFVLFLLRTILISKLFKLYLKRHVILFFAVLIVSVKVNLFTDYGHSIFEEQDWEYEQYHEDNELYHEEPKIYSLSEGQYFAELEYWKDTIRDFETIIIDVQSDKITFKSDNISNSPFVRSEKKNNSGRDYSFYLLQDDKMIPTLINFYDGAEFPEIQLFNIMGFNKINTVVIKSQVPADNKHALF